MSSIVKKMKVAETLSQLRLDIGLVKSGLCISRSQAQKKISEEKVSINGRLEKSSYKLQLGDEIEYRDDEVSDIELVPYDFPVDVVFEDDAVIVVNKPGGLVVHPAYGHPDDTLINALLFRQTKLSSSSDSFRPGLVHRIDKGTSGLLVLAKTDQAHHFLSKQFLQKTIHRRYWALCFSHNSKAPGRIESFLVRDSNHRQRFKSSQEEKGKRAITHFEEIEFKKPFSLFQLQLETGRTHQIRVHLSSQSNPIVGDEVYGGVNQAKGLKNQKLKKHILEMTRFALHAKELGFIHPTTKKELRFECPIPQDLHMIFELAGFREYLG